MERFAGQAVKKGDVVAVVDTTKAAVDVEIWFDATVIGASEAVHVGVAISLRRGGLIAPPCTTSPPAASTS